VTVIVATKDRRASLLALLTDLHAQTLPHTSWNVVVVDDGSVVPIGPDLREWQTRLALKHIRTTGVGQSAARQAAAEMATGDVLVFLDDDMRVSPTFLDRHLAAQDATPRAVVMGRIEAAPTLAKMPLFERYHSRQLDRWHHAMTVEQGRPVGTQLCMGNVSMRRADFQAVGGFDPSLMRSEDRELGVRLEQAGCRMVYGADAVSVHCSDHDSIDVWLRRAFLYGRYDLKIARKHPNVPGADPWRFWHLVNPLSRPMLAVVLLLPWLGRALSRAVYACARLLDRVGLSSPAVTMTALVYALEYFRGLRIETIETRPAGPIRRCARAIVVDHQQLWRVRAKYHADHAQSRLSVDLVRRVGLQMLVWYRVMRCLDECRVPLLPMVCSRLIRHLYGAEIHWKAQLAPGVSIVHGTGLVVGRQAHVGAGCILFQGVTLGESVDPITGIIGAPTLGADVHVGPGASLLGPIRVGDRTKIAAGSVLMRTVPAESLVMPPQASVTSRHPSFRHFRRAEVSA
jgi:serine acetyltransferase/glycosyltransferase involved in cell wall biosynthesis